MSLPVIKPQPTRIIYVFSVVIVVLFVMGFLFAVMYAVVVPLRAGILSNMAQYDVANSTYGNFELADTFMMNLWTYLLAIAVVFPLLYWVYIYSQRKGEVFYQ